MSNLALLQLATPELESVAELTVYVGPPQEAGHVHGLSCSGRRRIIPILGGEVRGMLTGHIEPGGADFQMVVSDTCADLDARYIVTLQSGEHVYVQNRALRRGSAQDIARLVRGEAVEPERIYFRCAPTFEVSSPGLQWLTESLFIGTGARYPDRVELRFFRVL